MKNIKSFAAVLAIFSLAFAAPSIDDQQVLEINIPRVQQNNFGDVKIVGGDLTEIRKFPWQVAILLEDVHTCGGTLIKPDVVLTAAHCVAPSQIDYIPTLTVRVGSDFRSSGGLVIAASRLMVHPLYEDCDTCPLDYDIALVYLATKAVVPGISAAPIDLWDANTVFPVGTFGTVSGWGAVLESNKTKSPQLRRVDLPLIPVDKCSAIYKEYLNHFNSKTLCAGFSVGGKDSCLGDSGGPLVIENKLAGIVAFGFGCGRPNIPGVYTSVAGYRAWIKIHAGV